MAKDPTQPSAGNGTRKPADIARMGIAGVILVVGLVLLVGGLSFGVVPYIFGVKPLTPRVFVGLLGAGVLTCLIGSFWFASQTRRLENLDGLPEPARSNKLYGRSLVGIGFALLVDAILMAVVIAALTWGVSRPKSVRTADESAAQQLLGDDFNAGVLEQLPKDWSRAESLQAFGSLFGRSPEESIFIGGLFVLSSLVALLGALFFFANSIWAKMANPERDPFDHSLFWAGLWFRIGEALIFNLVLFLMFRLYAPDQFLILPLISLLVGMFLKSGEQLIAGLANRLFAAAAAALPIEKGITARLKLGQLKLSNLPDPQKDKEGFDRALASISDAIWSLRGVDRPVIDPGTLVLRVRYDSDKATPEDLRQTIELMGFKASAAAEAASARPPAPGAPGNATNGEDDGAND